MDKIKNHDTYFLRRGDERIWVSSAHLALLSPTSSCYLQTFRADEISLTGMIFRCEQLSSFFYGVFSQDLRQIMAIKEPDLSEVEIEVWHTDNGKCYTLEHVFKLYKVTVVDFKHNGDCACCCGGDVTIKFDKIEIYESDKRKVDFINENSWFSPEYLKEYYESKIVLNEQ